MICFCFIFFPKSRRGQKMRKRYIANLVKKITWGKQYAYKAFQICQSQGWVEDSLECKQYGDMKHYNRVDHLTELGIKQLPILWRASIYNRRNWWKDKQIWSIPAAIVSILAIIGWLVKGVIWLFSSFS